jgi:[ribosomal protein S18]-alanine N-acetyltransferase
MQINQRWMIRRDMAEVLAIEAASREYPWSERDFLRRLGRKNCIGKVATCGEYGTASHAVVGFALFLLGSRCDVRLINLAVDPVFRRCGAARGLVDHLKRKLDDRRPDRTVSAWVSETELPGLLFLRSQGFRATEVVRGHFTDSGEDAVVMEFRQPAESWLLKEEFSRDC